jgi:hypothetical protein
MQEKRFGTTVLVAQRDFQVQHFFAVALEAKVAGFNDAGMNRTDGNLVNLFTIHTIERVIARDRFVSIERPPGCRRAIVCCVVAKRLKPRMAQRVNTELFGNLPLKRLCRRPSRCNRWVLQRAPTARGDNGAAYLHRTCSVIGREGVQHHTAIDLASPEQLRQPESTRPCFADVIAEDVRLDPRNRREVNTIALSHGNPITARR